MNNIEKVSFGLVLSGGGAKGAYHVGVVRALSEMGININAISGASIGSLNGAVVAAASDLSQATIHLQNIWQALADMKLFSLNINSLPQIALLLAAGLRLNPLGLVISTILSQVKKRDTAIFDNTALQQILRDNLDMNQLSEHGLPLYVSVFESRSHLISFFNFFKADLLGIENKYSTFQHIQALDKEAQLEYLLASAALPLLFEAQRSQDGTRISDGGQGGWISAQGNTPITPLIEAGYQNIIVTHLTNDTLWHRHDFPNATIIEIVPTIDFGGIHSLMKFNKDFIDELMMAGYNDTIAQLSADFNVLKQARNLQESSKKNLTDFTKIKEQSENIRDRLKRL